MKEKLTTCLFQAKNPCFNHFLQLFFFEKSNLDFKDVTFFKKGDVARIKGATHSIHASTKKGMCGRLDRAGLPYLYWAKF